ncbi:hypothetical protein [Ferroplasma sp.]|uniref:hypothetical protein n=1 Tax=Ferroplasma sp. TaxID=2591003 RepID=UPI002616B8A1|nr:hypothetical protein [Ferroplasma sp.]
MIVVLLPGKAADDLKGLLSCKSGSLGPVYMINMDHRIFILIIVMITVMLKIS